MGTASIDYQPQIFEECASQKIFKQLSFKRILLNGYRVSFRGDENVLELDRVMAVKVLMIKFTFYHLHFLNKVHIDGTKC